MENQKIQKKFSLIYKIVNFVFYFYIIFVFIFVVIFPLIFVLNYINGGALLSEIFASMKNPGFVFFVFSLVGMIGIFIILNIFILHLLRKISFSMKNGQVFTKENAKNIKVLFIFIAIFFIITGLIFSGGIISIVAGLFFMDFVGNIFSMIGI